MGNNNSNVTSNNNNKGALLGKDRKHAYGSCQTENDDETSGDEEDNTSRSLLESELSPLVAKSTTNPLERTCNGVSDYGDDYYNNSKGDNGDSSYYSLLKNNQAFRLYFWSLLVTNCGEWLTYIASIDLIENQLADLGAESRTAISILVLVRLLPNLFCCSLGGILADKYDRRKLMYGLDIASAWSTVLFVFAYE